MQSTVERNAGFRAPSAAASNPLGGDDEALMAAEETMPGTVRPKKEFEGRSTIITGPDGKRSLAKREHQGRELRPMHTMADKMRGLFLMGARIRNAKEEVNPMWHSFDKRCVQPIRSPEEMKRLLQFHGQSDHVMVVRYWQEGCTACNALDKVFEYLCHDQRKSVTDLHFFDVQREATPELTKGMVRFPQIKAFSAGQWADMDFKPPQDFRESTYAEVEKEVHRRAKRGEPVTALQAEEMYYSVAGPAVKMLLEDSIMGFYNQSRVRLHNYFKQVSQRRTWYFKKYVEPVGDSAQTIAAKLGEDASLYSTFGEATAPTVTTPSAAPTEVPDADPHPAGAGTWSKY